MNSDYKIILFSKPDFKGAALVVFEDVEHLNGDLATWNDRAHSIIVVSGSWTVYEHFSKGGICHTFSRGRYARLDDPLMGAISSLYRNLGARPAPPAPAMRIGLR